jgi:uncharacterized protein (TIGR04255 family)
LPDYARPPVNEVVLSVQSSKLSLTTPLLGLFWGQVRDTYPEFQIQPPLGPVIERFGDQPETVGPVAGLRLLETPETPRCWFIDRSGSRLVQLQQDRLIYNWRRVEDSDEYPRYAPVKQSFSVEYGRLRDFVASEPKAGELLPEWCEVTYVNHLPLEGTRWPPGVLERVFTLFAPWPAEKRLPAPELGQFALSFLMTDEAGRPAGRLHVSLKNAARRRDSVRVLVLELTARGQPEGEGLDGALRFMDRAHEWIVHGFTELTTRAMHQLWERRDV